MVKDKRFYIFIFLMIFFAVTFYFGKSKVSSEKTKLAFSHATALCYSINAYYEKNGRLPDTSENLLRTVFDSNSGNDGYTKYFFEKEGNELKYNKLSFQKYEFTYKENSIVFKIPELICRANLEQKDKSLGGGCDCSLIERQ